MTFLPIVGRELRVRARQKSTYRFRLSGAVIAIAIVGFMFLISAGFSRPGQLGQTTFGTLAWLAFIYCLLEGARATADCLSQEKRAGTLGLLFLTDLRAYDVVLGKLAATSLNSLYALLAVFPPLALPILLGGVTGGEFWRLVLVLINTLFLSLTVGLFVSAVSRDQRKALAATVGLMAAVTLLPHLFQWMLPKSAFPISPLSPACGFLTLDDASYRTLAGHYWWSVAMAHALAWAALVMASFVLPRAWQDKPALNRPEWHQRWRSGRWARRVFGPPSSRKWMLSLNPVQWLAGREQVFRADLWLLILAGGGAALTACILSGGDEDVALGILLCAVAFHFALAIMVAVRACYLLPDARDSGALELLLATPLPVPDIVRGYALALRERFFAPVTALVAIEVLLFVVEMGLLAGKQGRGEPVVFGVLIVGGWLVTSIMDLYAAGWYGLWMGLNAKAPAAALTRTILFVLVLPLISIFCCALLWPVVGLVKNLIFIAYGRDQLMRTFRQVAAKHAGGIEAAPEPKAAPGRLPPVFS